MSSPAATVTKRTSKKASSASSSPAASAAPVAAAPAPVVASNVIAHVEAAPAAVEVAAEENVNIVAQFNTLVEQVNTLRGTLSTVFSSMKKLEKQIPRELKKAQKGRRRRAATTNEDGSPVAKKPTVFTIPTQISDALCTFLGESKGTLVSRADVTTRVCKYARDHKLMDKQIIKADAPLRKLLGLKETDELKILNLQKYLAPHYTAATAAKTAAAATAAAATASAAATATASAAPAAPKAAASKKA